MSTPLQPWNMKSGGTLFSKGEAQRFCRQMVESQDYRESIQRRIKSDSLPPAIEAMLWYYAYGKPVEQVHLNVSKEEDLSTLSISELQARAAKLAEQLADATALADALPAQYSAVA